MQVNRMFIGLLIAAAGLGALNTWFTIAPVDGVEWFKAAFTGVLLAATLFLSGTAAILWLARVGIVGCLLGDYFLGIPSTPYFLQGMICFGVGYLLYAIAAGRGSQFWLLAAIACAISLTQYLIISPRDPVYIIATFVYMLIITFMLAAGWSRWLDDRGSATLLRALGLSLFYFSDSLIGYREFGGVSAIPSWLIYSTYAVGQCLFVWSLRAAEVSWLNTPYSLRSK